MGMTKEEIEALATQAEERCLRDAKFALGPGGGGISDVALIAARRASSEWAIIATTLRRLAK
jgi:glycerol dehydrogenase-like iron-containing ADH family enzyme